MNNDKLIKGLFSLAWGYLFIHINIKMVTIDMFPDWIGYCLLVKGISSLSLYEPSAKLLRPLGTLLVIWGIVEWFTSMNQISISNSIISLIITIIGLYFHFQLLTNVADIANRCDTYKGNKLLLLRSTRAILVTIFTIIHPIFDNYYLLLAFAAANLIIGLTIASSLFKLRRLQNLGELTV